MSKQESYFGGKLDSFEVEMMKLRRWYRGKQKEAHIFRVMYEGTAKHKGLKFNPELHKQDIKEHRHDEGQFDLFADAIDECLKRCGIEIQPKYLLKSELKK